MKKLYVHRHPFFLSKYKLFFSISFVKCRQKTKCDIFIVPWKMMTPVSGTDIRALCIRRAQFILPFRHLERQSKVDVSLVFNCMEIKLCFVVFTAIDLGPQRETFSTWLHEECRSLGRYSFLLPDWWEEITRNTNPKVAISEPIQLRNIKLNALARMICFRYRHFGIPIPIACKFPSWLYALQV